LYGDKQEIAGDTLFYFMNNKDGGTLSLSVRVVDHEYFENTIKYYNH